MRGAWVALVVGLFMVALGVTAIAETDSGPVWGYKIIVAFGLVAIASALGDLSRR